MKKHWRRKKRKQLIKKIFVTVCLIGGLGTAFSVMALEAKRTIIMKTGVDLYSQQCGDVEVYFKEVLNEEVCSHYRQLVSTAGVSEPAIPAPSVEEQIRDIAEEMNFEYTDYLIRLAICESSLNPNNYLVNKNGTVDIGLYQWNMYYHPEVTIACATDLRCSTLKTMEAINNGNQGWWVCDSKI